MELAKKKLQEHRKTFDPDNLKDFIDVFLDNASHNEANPVYSGRYALKKLLGMRNIKSEHRN